MEFSGGIHCQSGLPSLDLLVGCRGAARWAGKILSRERCFELFCWGVFRRNKLPKAFRATLFFFSKNSK